jgi:DNA-binding transcriptional MerR regulator
LNSDSENEVKAMTTKWTLPGTMIQLDRSEVGQIGKVFDSMFLTGGMTLSQVCSLTGLEAYMVQNWVKRGFLTSPSRKRYSLEQVCRIININMLKSILPMERICGLLSYVNGNLDDESDDIILDSKLYFIFVRLAVRARELDDRDACRRIIEEELAEYTEPVPGAKERVVRALETMLTAWLAAKMRAAAEKMLEQLD